MKNIRKKMGKNLNIRYITREASPHISFTSLTFRIIQIKNTVIYHYIQQDAKLENNSTVDKSINKIVVHVELINRW
jgi:hypothetical protein